MQNVNTHVATIVTGDWLSRVIRWIRKDDYFDSLTFITIRWRHRTSRFELIGAITVAYKEISKT